MRAGSRLVSFAWVDPSDNSDARHFPVPTKLARVIRVRLANDVPVGLHTLYVPADVAIAARFTAERLAAEPRVSFYRALAEVGIHIARAEEHLSARTATTLEVRCLDIRRGAPIMSVLRLTREHSDQLIEVVRADYVGDRYDYVVNLERRGDQSVGSMVTGWNRV